MIRHLACCEILLLPRNCKLISNKLTAMNLKPLLKTLSGTAGYVTPLLHVVDLRGQNSTVTALSSASGTPAINVLSNVTTFYIVAVI